MQSYKLRINILQNVEPSVYDGIETYMSRYIRAYETNEEGTNPHYHYLFFFNQGVKELAFRSHIRKCVGSGNGYYSMKRCDEEYPIEYIAYIFKQGENKIVGKWPQEVIEEACSYDERVKNELKNRRIVKKSGSSRLLKIIEYCLGWERPVFIPNGENLVLELDMESIFQGVLITSDNTLIEAVLQYHIDNRLVIRETIIADYVRTIKLMFDKRYKTQMIISIRGSV